MFRFHRILHSKAGQQTVRVQQKNLIWNLILLVETIVTLLSKLIVLVKNHDEEVLVQCASSVCQSVCFIIVKFARAVLVILHNKFTYYVRSVGQLNVLAQCVSSGCQLSVLSQNVSHCVSSVCQSGHQCVSQCNRSVCQFSVLLQYVSSVCQFIL